MLVENALAIFVGEIPASMDSTTAKSRRLENHILCLIAHRAPDYSLELSELIQQLACWELRHLIFYFSGRLSFINVRTTVLVLEVWAEKVYSANCQLLKFQKREFLKLQWEFQSIWILIISVKQGLLCETHFQEHLLMEFGTYFQRQLLWKHVKILEFLKRIL